MSTVTKISDFRETTEIDIPRELAHRSADGIDVTLLWSQADDTLWVLVVDTRSGATFVVACGDDRPLDVFAHPYAYAAVRGIAA